MKKVLLTTVFTGYNYGSSLQAFAGKTILRKLDYDCTLVARKSLVRGRDIRVGKLLTILWRSLALKGKTKALNTYQGTYNKKLIEDSVERFNRFTDEYLHPTYLTWGGLKSFATDCEACFAGSDQIWNSSTLYVDPMYYLRFTSKRKRIALAPSFGRDFVADYNQKKIGGWIADFSAISIREDSGVGLIKTMTGRDAAHLVDPTLLVDNDTWRNTLGLKKADKKYILAYFLDKPTEKGVQAINDLKKILECEVIGIPYEFEDMSYCDRVVPTGPVEFLELVDNASVVLTDSFHGTAFSINLHTPFYVFGRDYGTAHSQNSRVESILRKMNMINRFDPTDAVASLDIIDFDYSEKVLAEERGKAMDYIQDALSACK